MILEFCPVVDCLWITSDHALPCILYHAPNLFYFVELCSFCLNLVLMECVFFFSLYFVWIGMKEVLVPFVFNFTSYELVWRKCLFFLCLTLLNMNWYEVFVLFLFNFTSRELVWSKYLFFFFFFFSLLFWIVENGKKKC